MVISFLHNLYIFSFETTCLCSHKHWPSCSKHYYLNELVSGQNVNCSGKYNIKFTGIFAEKNVSSFCYSHFLSKNISIYAIFNDQVFSDMLANDIVSFEQMSHGSQ